MTTINTKQPLKTMNFDLKTEAEESIKFFTTHLEKLRKFKEITKIAKTTFTKISTEIELSDLNSLGELIDLSSLITISHLDLIIANQALYYSKSDWEKIYFIKNIYLTIFESLKTYKNYEKFLSNITTSNSPELKSKHNDVTKEIKEFRKHYKYSSDIDSIRNNISGHICKDFELYYDTIIKFNGDEVAKMCIEFFKIIQKLQNFSTEMLTPFLNNKEIVESKPSR